MSKSKLRSYSGVHLIRVALEDNNGCEADVAYIVSSTYAPDEKVFDDIMHACQHFDEIVEKYVANGESFHK